MKIEGCLVATDEDFKNLQKPKEKTLKPTTKQKMFPRLGQVRGQASQVAIVWKTLIFCFLGFGDFSEGFLQFLQILL